MTCTNFEVASAFRDGCPAGSINARTDGQSYWLHGNRIAYRREDGRVVGNWCGFYTLITAAHLNLIIGRVAPDMPLVGYASARDRLSKAFYII